jgi:hypothetical protein
MSEILPTLIEAAQNAESYTTATRGVAKKTLSNRINTLLAANSKGFFRDQGWAGVNRLFKLLWENGYDFNLISAEYQHNAQGEMSAKVWRFEIPFLLPSGREDKLYGNITASLSGTKADPTERYDLAAYVS